MIPEGRTTLDDWGASPRPFCRLPRHRV